MSLFSVDAEAAVIGAVLLEPDCAPALFEKIRPEDFYETTHRTWWGAMMALAGKGEPLDVVTVAEHLEATDRAQETGGLAALAELARNTPSARNADAYADVVADMASRRELLRLLPGLDEEARDRSKPLEQLVSEAQARLGDVVRAVKDDEIQPVSHYLDAELITPLDRRFNGEEQAFGVPLGLRDLDKATMGGRPGDLIVIGARPSMGKTAMMLNIIRDACCEKGEPTFCASMEMKRAALLSRLSAAMADIPLDALRDPQNHMNDEYWARMAYPITRLNESPLVIDERGGRSIRQIRHEVEKVKERYGRVGLVCIDYLSKVRIEGNYGQRHDRGIEEIVTGAKSIARDFDCPVVLLAQLNRSLESRPNKRPMMSDLKDSSAIEQEADLIAFLYRDEVYNEQTEAKGIVEIILGKQREGETKTVFAASRLSHGRFDDLAPQWNGERS